MPETNEEWAGITGPESVGTAHDRAMTDPIIEHVLNGEWAEYTVRVTVPEDVWWQESGRPGYARFEVFEVEAQDATTKALIYEKPGSTDSFNDPTESLDLAQSCARGDVKWDGCVNYEVSTEDNVMLHACSSDGVRYFLAAIQRGYDIALELVGGGL